MIIPMLERNLGWLPRQPIVSAISRFCMVINWRFYVISDIFYIIETLTQTHWFFKFFPLILLCMFVSFAWINVFSLRTHSAHKGQKRAPDTLGLELQIVSRPHMLGRSSSSSVRTSRALNCWDISSVLSTPTNFLKTSVIYEMFCCVTYFSLERNTLYSSTERKFMIDQSNSCNKVQFGEPMRLFYFSFLLISGIRWRVIYRSRNDLKEAASPRKTQSYEWPHTKTTNLKVSKNWSTENPSYLKLFWSISPRSNYLLHFELCMYVCGDCGDSSKSLFS